MKPDGSSLIGFGSSAPGGAEFLAFDPARGISLEPIRDSLFTSSNIATFFENDIRCDITDLHKLKREFGAIEADVVIHLAAQALVRESYKDPLETFETNVIGTMNVLMKLELYLKSSIIL